MTVRRPHIAILEDEEHLAVGIRFNLEAEGYRVTCFRDGGSALQAIGAAPRDIDLLILDLMLPGMSGYAVCEALRGQGWDRPVLILSARTLSDDRKRGFDVGANQYLSKPFELDELISRVRNLLTHYRPRPQPPAHVVRSTFGQAEVDFATYQVTCNGAPVRMTQLEMKLLQYFIEHEGRVIPRQELLENVWGLHGQVQTRAPDQFIRRLRKAFEPDPAQPRHFLTIRDAGYRFVAHPT
ncbi:MAG: response regulator transcription factor [Pirellulaceae bacterium]|jgi:two-component system OmpR family response regulator|nr:response regulator transcription factor [Pirellulaceae bacterium]